MGIPRPAEPEVADDSEKPEEDFVEKKSRRSTGRKSRTETEKSQTKSKVSAKKAIEDDIA